MEQTWLGVGPAPLPRRADNSCVVTGSPRLVGLHSVALDELQQPSPTKGGLLWSKDVAERTWSKLATFNGYDGCALASVKKRLGEKSTLFGPFGPFLPAVFEEEAEQLSSGDEWKLVGHGGLRGDREAIWRSNVNWGRLDKAIVIADRHMSCYFCWQAIGVKLDSALAEQIVEFIDGQETVEMQGDKFHEIALDLLQRAPIGCRTQLTTVAQPILAVALKL